MRIGGPIQLVLNGALLDDGWFVSYYTKESINRERERIPWCTYSFIKFIEPRLKKEFDVFEFGCGNSTYWYAKKVNSIRSVEHNKMWMDKIFSLLPANATIVNQSLTVDGDYAKEVLRDNRNYHIIIIDGEDRNNCLKHSISKLKKDGVIIFDNSDRMEYEQSFELLSITGFRRIDFVGIGPIVSIKSCTSIFYRENNCLGI
jgi:hypothetical protein